MEAAAEGVGTALLLAIVVGSGIMGERLAGGNAAVALLEVPPPITSKSMVFRARSPSSRKTQPINLAAPEGPSAASANNSQHPKTLSFPNLV